jgi:Tfp pilus assembly protein PilF
MAFLPVLRAGFVSWDDDKNFVLNTSFRGLDLHHLRWMWSTFHLGHYVPLSWMTLGLDYMIWGLNPLGFHLTNLILHTANSVLVFFVARRLLVAANVQRAVWAAVVGALIYSIHPLRVESVAWVTERRDVLSAFFLLTTVLFYLRWRESAQPRPYLSALIAFVCALLSKGTSVTLPVVLLIIEIYPLRGIAGAVGWTSDAARRVYRALAPFAALALATAMMTLVALQRMDQLTPVQKGAVSAYGLAFYFWKTILPLGLSPLYAMPNAVDPMAAKFVVSYTVVAILAVLAWRARATTPGLVAALAAFVVVCLPLLGVVQNGPQIAADRYTYHASIALAILAAAALTRLQPRIATAAAVVIVGVLATLTWRQTGVWRDSETLWTQVLRVEPSSPIGHNNRGNVFAQRGDEASAIAEYQRAVELSPRYAEAHNNLGVALARLGRAGDAVPHYQHALSIDPKFADAENNWGIAAVQQGNADEGMKHYRLALAINPANADAHTNWGNALVRLGRPAEAVRHYEEAVNLRPDHADAHHNWGVALARQGLIAEAIEQFRQALSINPNHAEAREYLARARQIAPQR